MFGKEPTLIIQSIVAALNAVQIAAIPMPIWAHTIIAVVTIVLGALANRSQVTPAPAALPPAGPQQPVR